MGWSLQQSPARGRAQLPSPPRAPLLLGGRRPSQVFLSAGVQSVFASSSCQIVEIL